MNGEKLYNFLEQICGERIVDIERASTMLWVGIGDTTENLNRKGTPIINGKIALCLQCAWKIVNNQQKKILVASSDIFSPKSSIDKECFDWNVQGNNLCDKRISNWIETRSPIYIKEYNINRYGDLQIIFSNDEQLRIFINASDYTEAWRLFKFREGKHLVFTGLGYEFL